MSNFEWQTEEDNDTIWENSNPAPQPPTPTPPWRRRWLPLTLLLLLAVGSLGYWQIQQRVTAVTTQVESELLATHTLLQQVAANQDNDLFRSLLSGRDMDWAKVQLTLLDEGKLWTRPPFRVVATPTNATPEIILSPDLTQAEVVFPITYSGAPGGNGVNEAVWQQTAVYRLGNNRRWLLAQPDSNFWGAWQTIGSDTLTLTFPQRDQPLAQRLLADLEADIAQACRALGNDSTCPASLTLQLTFSTDTTLLLRNDSRRPMLLNNREIELPTPTLVGLPTDEAGYELLRQGYAGQVLTAVIAQLVDYPCCPEQHFFTALTDRQLSQWGIQPWPLTPAAYNQLLHDPHQLERVTQAWQSNRVRQDDWRLVYAAIEFLLAEIVPNANLVTWQQELAQQDSRSELAQLINSNQLATAWREEWIRFIYDRATAVNIAHTSSPQPTSLTYDCNTQTHTVAQTYDFTTQQWQETYRVPSPDNGYFTTDSQLTPLPDGTGFLVEQQQNDEGALRGNLLVGRFGETFLLRTVTVDILTSYPGYYFTGEQNSSEGLLLLATRDNPRLISRFFLLDLDACTSASCELAERPFWATWSADGQQTLLADKIPSLQPNIDILLRPWQRPLSLGDATGIPQQPLPPGAKPFWLNNTQYGTVRVLNPATRQLAFVVTNAASGATTTTITGADLAAALTQPPATLFVVAAQPFPNNPNQILLEARDSLAEPNQVYLFQLRLDAPASDKLRRLYQSSRELTYALAANGRWLAVQRREGANDRVQLVDIATGATNTLGAEQWHWLEDSHWLLREFNGHSLAHNLDTDYQQLITPPLTDCRYIG